MKLDIPEGYEQIVREVTIIGNGAHIFAPRGWVGEKIVLVRALEKPIKEKIIDLLKPYLENIKGVYLYGSHARGAAREDSDIDVLVITNNKIKIKSKDFDLIALEEEKISKAIEVSPILMYSIFNEAKAIINQKLLDELRLKYKINKRIIKAYIEETRRIIKINEDLLDPYSIILRLRGIYIIKNLLVGKRYSQIEFKNWISENVKGINFEKIYNSYLKEKSGKKSNDRNEADLKQLLSFLREQTNNIHNKNGKKRKKTKEGN